MKRFSTCLSLVFGLAAVIVFSSWGFLIHRTVNQLAIYQLPENMKLFFYEHKQYLVQHSVRPDLRRNSDTTEAPKHYIDAEMYGDSAIWKMPGRWDDAVARYSKDTLIEYGYVPYWIMAMKEKLTNAFRQRNADSILFYAADLGHYIGDAHVPLHTTVNYDGQLTNQKGLHSLWESTVPELALDEYRLYSRHKAQYLKDPEAAIWKTVRTSFSLVPEVFALEKEVSKRFTDATKYRIQNRNGREIKSYSTEFARDYGRQINKAVNKRLLEASNQIADFWYTCWVDGGKPDISALIYKPTTRAQMTKMKKEWKAYRNNQLLKKGLLVARQVNTTEFH